MESGLEFLKLNACKRGGIGNCKLELARPSMLRSPAIGARRSQELIDAEMAEAEAAALRETPAQKRQRIAELEERARLYGDSVKQSAQAKVLERKWLRFLLVHGEEYGFNSSRGPTVELVKRFVTYCFCTRDNVSAIGPACTQCSSPPVQHRRAGPQGRHWALQCRPEAGTAPALGTAVLAAGQHCKALGAGSRYGARCSAALSTRGPCRVRTCTELSTAVQQPIMFARRHAIDREDVR